MCRAFLYCIICMSQVLCWHTQLASMDGLDLSILEPQALKRHRQEALPDGALQAQGVDLGQLSFPLPAVTDVRAC
jgi:hypothetical protein